MSVPFRERNPVTIGAISLAVIALLLLASFRADRLPLIGGGDTYYAMFSEVGGLQKGNEVRIAGVRVGEVGSLDLQNGQVKVGFTVDSGSGFGPQTGAEIRVKTLLGQMFLSLTPEGKGQLAEGATIPASRTTSPYDVVQAFSGLSNRIEDIDTDRLAKALDTLATVTKNTPESFRGTLRGLSALSETVASRDAELDRLLKNTRSVSKVLATRDQDLVTLMRDASTLLDALTARRAAVHNLLVSTSQVSKELTLLVQQTRADLKPALAQLNQVVQLLLKNQQNLDESLRLMAPFYRVFSNTLGNGPWFDTFIQNIPVG